jgi:hypothetical protein
MLMGNPEICNSKQLAFAEPGKGEALVEYSSVKPWIQAGGRQIGIEND